MKNDKLTQKDSDIIVAKILIEVAKQGGTITYKDLGKKTTRLPVSFSKTLERISDICIANNMPRLSAIVVSKETRRPQVGYYNVYYGGEQSPRNEGILFAKDCVEIYEYDNWDSLLPLI